MKKVLITKTQKETLDKGGMIRTLDSSDNIVRVALINGKLSIVKVDGAKPQYNKVVLCDSSATTLSLTMEETKALLENRNAGIKEIEIFRSSGYKATTQEVDYALQSKLISDKQFKLDYEYAVNGKVASLQLQKGLKVARRVLVDVNTLQVIADNNTSVEVIEEVEEM